jgi:transcriptional regulator with XRE-family HTH domain
MQLKADHLDRSFRRRERAKMMTQTELARALEIRDYRNVMDWEKDRAIPRPTKLKLISEVLSIPVEELTAARDRAEKRP